MRAAHPSHPPRCRPTLAHKAEPGDGWWPLWHGSSTATRHPVASPLSTAGALHWTAACRQGRDPGWPVGSHSAHGCTRPRCQAPCERWPPPVTVRSSLALEAPQLLTTGVHPPIVWPTVSTSCAGGRGRANAPIWAGTCSLESQSSSTRPDPSTWLREARPASQLVERWRTTSSHAPVSRRPTMYSMSATLSGPACSA